MRERRVLMRWMGCALGMTVAAGCGTGRLPKPDSRIGADPAFTVVDLRPSGGRILDTAGSSCRGGGRLHLRPYVELTSAWCPACHWLDQSVSTRSLSSVFGGTLVIRIDVDHWEGLLSGSGLDYHSGPLPAFVALARGGHPIGDWIDRAEWASDAPASAAPVLADFFHWAG